MTDATEASDATRLPEIVVISAPGSGTNFFCECLDDLSEVRGLYEVFSANGVYGTLENVVASPHRLAYVLVRSRLDAYISVQKNVSGESGTHTDTSEVRPEIDVDAFLEWAVDLDRWFERMADVLEAMDRPYRILSYDADVNRDKSELLSALSETLRADGIMATVAAQGGRDRFQRQDAATSPFEKVADGERLRAEFVARDLLDYACAEPLAERDARRGLAAELRPRPNTTSPLLPERARLLHIGLPKTGTTALQRTAVRKRDELARAGVLYPRTLTKRHDHLIPTAALMGRRIAEVGGVPEMEHWNDLLARVEADDSRRVWISHEWVCESDDDQVRRFRDELGEALHAVISVRQYGTILASTWQEFLKSTMLHEFEDWASYALTDEQAPDGFTQRQIAAFHRRSQQGRIVERWARILGRDRVTVVVVDPDHRDQQTDAFEDMLGLERGMLGAEESGAVANRSMTVEETALMLALNRAYADPDSALEKRHGRLPIALSRELLTRTPGADERKLTLPRWAAELADVESARHADEIEATGVRVIGDLDALRTASKSTDDTRHNASADVPLDAAVRAARAIAEEAVKRAHAVEQEHRPDERARVDDVPAAELAKEVARRARGRARRALRRVASKSRPEEESP
ncbi:MAG TPA: hypothetical protein H9769_08130 [Candidatus Microbacterium pullistercoris]|nr:hypothetical protein [Candidatus Microbacterium pullistercoris]